MHIYIYNSRQVKGCRESVKKKIWRPTNKLLLGGSGRGAAAAASAAVAAAAANLPYAPEPIDTHRPGTVNRLTPPPSRPPVSRKLRSSRNNRRRAATAVTSVY